jgi:parallel beta-helix repeat protein
MEKKIAVIWISFLLLFGLIVVVSDITEQVSGETIWVDDSFTIENSTHKKTIQAAIDSANSGDTIHIHSGTYYENIIVNKSISLIGEDSSSTVIDGRGRGNVVYISSDNVTVSGFSIKKSESLRSGIELHEVNNCIVEGNILYNNTISILLLGSDYNNINNNSVFDPNRDGIFLKYSDNNHIKDNVINTTYHGIYLLDSDSNDVYQNSVSTLNHYGIRTFESEENKLVANVVTNSYRGIFIMHEGENVIYKNTIFNNRYGICFDGGKSANISYNKIYHNEIGIIFDTTYSGVNNIYRNNISENTIGIFISSTRNPISIYNNDITYNEQGICLDFIFDHIYIFNNIIANNNLSINISTILTEDSYRPNQYINNLNHYKVDSDGDGIIDGEDFDPYDPNVRWDSDGDGHPDSKDAFPFDSSEWIDSDGDGIGDNADTDENGNGIVDDWEIPLAILILIIPLITVLSLFSLMKKKKKIEDKEP